MTTKLRFLLAMLLIGFFAVACGPANVQKGSNQAALGGDRTSPIQPSNKTVIAYCVRSCTDAGAAHVDCKRKCTTNDSSKPVAYCIRSCTDAGAAHVDCKRKCTTNPRPKPGTKPGPKPQKQTQVIAYCIRSCTDAGAAHVDCKRKCSTNDPSDPVAYCVGSCLDAGAAEADCKRKCGTNKPETCVEPPKHPQPPRKTNPATKKSGLIAYCIRSCTDAGAAHADCKRKCSTNDSSDPVAYCVGSCLDAGAAEADCKRKCGTNKIN